jgi:hypothetical protein
MTYSQSSNQAGEQQDQGQRQVGGTEPRDRSSNGDEFDAGYHQWRSEQMRAVDDDYRTWRQDGHQSFSQEFETWRNERRHSGTQNAPGGQHDEGERAPEDQGNAITSQEQNQNVAERTEEEERDK